MLLILHYIIVIITLKQADANATETLVDRVMQLSARSNLRASNKPSSRVDCSLSCRGLDIRGKVKCKLQILKQYRDQSVSQSDFRLQTGSQFLIKVFNTMDLLKNKWKGLVKAYNHYMRPNDNPTEHDRTAFDLLTKGEVDLFIEYADTHPVNVHVHDYNSVNLLIKAQDVANDTHPCKKLLSESERITRAIKATHYLLDRGVDINYRDKTGGTALYAAVHWQNIELVEVLLRRGADPNLGSTEHFINLPLISATIKKNERLITLLISYGADIDQAFALAKDPKRGFQLSEKQRKTLRSASNLESMIRRRRYEIALGKNTVLSLLSQAQFQEMCFYM